MTKIVLEGNVDQKSVSYEDSGCAVIVEPTWKVTGGDENLFVRIQSWDESIDYDPSISKQQRAALGHKSIHELMGKKIRVTIEVVEE